MVRITSISNPKVKELASLIKKKKVRTEKKQYVVEGVRMFLEAPKKDIRQIFVSDTFMAEHEELLRGKDYVVLEDSLFSKIADTKNPQGILCVMKQPVWKEENIYRKRDPYLFLLEEIQDPGNMGTILRSAEAAGMDGVVVSKDSVDLFSPKVIRSTMGAIFRVPVFTVENLHETIKKMESNGIGVYAACLEDSVDYDQKNYLKGTAFLIGNEGNGLKEDTISLSKEKIKIPMLGKTESLNAGVAASVLAFEGARQRRNERKRNCDGRASVVRSQCL